MQQALWMGQKLQPGVPLYNMAHTFCVRGNLDADAFGGAFDKLVAGTDVLRAVVEEPHDQDPQFEICDDLPAAHQFSDVSAGGNPSAALADILDAQASLAFTPGEPLYDSHLVKTGQDEFTWCFTLHHLIVDFLSVTLLYERMSALLAEDGADLSWPEYASYMDWTEAQQEHPRAKRAQTYWNRNVPPADEPQLEVFGNTLTGTNPRAARIELNLGRERSQKIEALASQAPFRVLSRDLALLNLFATFLWSWLYRVSNRNRITVGTPLHNRTSAAFKDTAGLLINILPVSEAVQAGDSFAELAKRISLSTLDATKYAAFAPQQTDKHRSFEAILNFLTGTVGDFAGMPCDFQWHHSGYADPHHALRLQVQDFNASGEFTLFLDINEDLLTAQERHRVSESFLRIIDACLEDVEKPVAAVDLLTTDDRARLVTELNATDRVISTAGSMNELLEARWTDSADETAIAFGSERVSYRELDKRVDNIAEALRSSGLQQGDAVAIWMNRSPDLVATILAALRLGAVYVPIDPAQPQKRVERILADAEPAITAIDDSRPMPDNVRSLCISAIGNTGAAKCEYPSVTGQDAAYVIYTSGSTGEPKGVVVEHRGIVNYIAWATAQYVTAHGIQRPAMPFYSSPAVDLTLTSIFLPLAAGGSIVIYEASDLRNDLSIVDVFERDEVDILKLTPAHLSLLQRLDSTAERIGMLILGGENLTTAAANSAHSMFPRGVTIYNEYGPTETVVGCMIHRYDPISDTGHSVPIGVPIDNMRVYALDRHGMPVPPGVVGELYIGGVGVAREYRNRPELTAEAFAALPSVGEEKAYRTGDLVRFGTDGLLTYLGRQDDQIKIRGNRIELGEIEACLQKHPDIDRVGIAVEEKQSTGTESDHNAESYALCIRCGLPGNYPQAAIDSDTGVCELCRQYDANRERIDAYFKNRDELRQLVERIPESSDGGPNAIALTSGGKDSTYALHQLVRMGLKPLVFTLDNGFISEQALANVRKVVDDLGLELVIGKTPHMNAIFADSLQRHCNVCNGCFKTIYTLSINLAVERGIDYIFTGLSRGQLFETRLAPEMFAGAQYNIDTIEQNVKAARKAYHRRHDAVNERLDVSAFGSDALFEKIQIIDFYRYWDVGLDELYDYLENAASWSRPADTGRSTNCLINEAGISVHKQRRGYHNYALPYSWDVRLGHKTREDALHELNDEIDDVRVAEMLSEVGYAEAGTESETQLVGVFTAPKTLDIASVRNFLAEELPGYMVPHRLVQVDELPLSPSGKLDRSRLASLAGSGALHTDNTAARNDLEMVLSDIWTDVLGLESLGVHENFFDIGGTSLPALQIVARCEQAFEIKLPLAEFFTRPTIAGLGESIEDILVSQLEALSDEDAEEAFALLGKEDDGQ